MLAATALMWGSAYMWIEYALEGFQPGAIALVRIALGVLVLGVFAAARRGAIPSEDRPRIVVLGIVWLALPLLLFPLAQERVSSAFAGMLAGASPLFAALLTAVLLRSAPRRLQAVGLMIGFLGMSAVVVAGAGDGVEADLPGTLLALGAVLCYSLATVLAVPLQQRYGALPVILRALVVALVASLPLGVPALAASDPDAGAMLAMLPLGILSTGLGYVAFTELVGRAGGPRGATAIYFVPVVAIVLGATFQDETIGPLALAGTAVLLGGVYLSSRADRGT